MVAVKAALCVIGELAKMSSACVMKLGTGAEVVTGS